MNPHYYEDKTLTTSDAFKKLQSFKETNPSATVNMSFEVIVPFFNVKPLVRYLSEANGKIGIVKVTAKVTGLILKKVKINICGMAATTYSVITDVASMYPNADYDT